MNACFQTRPRGESGDDVASAMSFARLSSETGGGADGVAVSVDTGAGGDIAADGDRAADDVVAGGCVFEGFFLLEAGMVTFGGRR